MCVRLSSVKHVSNVSKIYTNMDEQILNRLVGVLREFKDENVTLKLFYEEKKLKFFMTNLPPRQHKGTNRRINNAIPLNELRQTSTPTKSNKRKRNGSISRQTTPTPEKVRENFDENPLEPTLLDDERDEDQSDYEQNDVELHYSIPTENRFNALLKKMDDKNDKNDTNTKEDLNQRKMKTKTKSEYWQTCSKYKWFRQNNNQGCIECNEYLDDLDWIKKKRCFPDTRECTKIHRHEHTDWSETESDESNQENDKEKD